MNDETPAILSDVSNAPAHVLALGPVLREARKKQGLEIDEVAHQLRMSARQILALEEENFAALSSPPFVRGFIRNYAKLLKLDAEPLLAAYREVNSGNVDSAAITLPSERIAIVNGARKIWITYLAASLIVLLAGSAWWAYMEVGDNKSAAPVKAESSQKAIPANLPEPVIMPAPAEPVAPMPPVTTAAEPQPVTPAANNVPNQPLPPISGEPAALQGSIHLTVSEQSWISVTDSTGKEVFNKIKASGTEDFADGTPPFSVVVGNANGVQLSFKGKPVDLAPHTRANVARLTLE